MHRQRVDDASGHDDIGICRNQLGGSRLASLRVLAGHPAVDDEIASLDPAEPPHGLVEPLARKCIAGNDEADMAGLRRLLRAGSPADSRYRRAEQHIAAPHYSMTSS